jgi:hypothetical protein
MDFGKIIEGVYIGKKACREGWNGKGMYIFDFSHSVLKLKEDSDFEEERYDVSELDGIIEIGSDEKTFKLENFVLLKTAANTCIPWNASQADMQAHDWEFIN